MNQLTAIQQFAVWVLPVLFAITVHEVAHGFVADLLGDKTARIMGRLTLNPIKHIDLVGTILVPAILFIFGGFIFGWAKPVPISARNFKKPRRDMMFVAAAGPLSNLIMMVLWALIAKLGIFLTQYGFNWALAIAYMGGAGIMINSALAILNLIPIPPLDGGHILMGLLPAKWAAKVSRIEPYGFFILLFLLATGLLKYLIAPMTFLLQAFIPTWLGF